MQEKTLKPGLLQRLRALFHHRWLDAADVHKSISAQTLESLRLAVERSEQEHTGEIRICVESSLPSSYLWRHLRDQLPMAELTQQRALMLFAKLHVWDTPDNNGVLIYLLLAERAIEIVADRDVCQHVSNKQWQQIVDGLSNHLEVRAFEAGLLQALQEVSDLLIRYYPLQPQQAPTRANILPDTPVVL